MGDEVATFTKAETYGDGQSPRCLLAKTSTEPWTFIWLTTFRNVDSAAGLFSSINEMSIFSLLHPCGSLAFLSSRPPFEKPSTSQSPFAQASIDAMLGAAFRYEL